MGQITSDNASVFPEKLINRLMDRPEYKLQNSAPFIFLGVDPNGGGSSEMAIVTMVMESNNIVITGMESHPARSHDMIEMLLVQPIRASRGHPDLRDSWIIFFPENNLGQEVSEKILFLSNLTKLLTLTLTLTFFSGKPHGAHGEGRAKGVHLLRKRQGWGLYHARA